MGLAQINRVAIYLLIASIGATIAASPAEADAAGEFRLVIPDGPFEQWKTITFELEPAADAPSEGSATARNVDLAITTPSGQKLAIPAFSAIDDESDGRLRCRFTPRETGTYLADVGTTSANGSPDRAVRFQAAPSPDGRGFLRVERDRPYFLLFDNGEQFRGIGTNLGWEPRRRRRPEHTYDALFPRISANGLNTIRTWICPWNMSLDWNAPQLGAYEPGGLKRLDEMLALAEEHGIYVVLVLGYHGELQTETGAFPGNDRWKENPYNVANGGPCETPADFFTNEEAKANYKKRLRLLVARIAGHPHLLAWEFWNEIDHIERRGPVPGPALVAWHEEMADYLREIDPYDHPITTSISVKAPEGMWELEDLDLIMLHPYGMTDKFTQLLTRTNARYQKPAIAGEFSYSWKPANRGEEPDFERELRLGLWRGLMSPTPVLPMTWWWEFHDSRDDWRYFQPVSKLSRQMTALNDSEWRPLELETANDSIEAYGVAVGESRFLWLRNRGESPIADASIKIRGESSDGYRVRQLNTVTGDEIGGAGPQLQVVEGALTLSLPALDVGEDTSFILSR